MKNKIVLDITEKPEVASFFAAKKPGDQGAFPNVMFQIDDLTDDEVTLSVLEVELPQGTEVPLSDTGGDSPLSVLFGSSDSEEV